MVTIQQRSTVGQLAGFQLALINFVYESTVVLSALFEAPALLQGAVSTMLPPTLSLVLSHHLTMVAGVPGQATTFIYPTTLTSIEAGYNALAELTPRSIEPCFTLTRVFLNTLAPVLARGLTNTSLTAAPLEPCRAVTNPRSRTRAPVHALRGAHRYGAEGSLPTWSADAPSIAVTLASAVAFSVTIWVWSKCYALLP